MGAPECNDTMRPEAGTLLSAMSKPLLESFVATTDLLVRLFSILAAISALLYFLSSWRLHKLHAQQRAVSPAPEKQHVEPGTGLSQAQGALQKLQADNANLAAELQQEHEARLLAQWRLGPRFVAPAARAEMLLTLEPFAGHRLNFGYFTDLETAEFAEELLDIFKAAGWKPQVFKIKTIQPTYGIQCGGPNPNDPALQALTKALQLVDQRLTSEQNGALPSGQTLEPQLADQVQMWVMIGLKRPHLRKKLQTGTAAQPPTPH